MYETLIFSVTLSNNWNTVRNKMFQRSITYKLRKIVELFVLIF